MADTGTNILVNRLRDELHALEGDLNAKIVAAVASMLNLPTEAGNYKLTVSSTGAYSWTSIT